MVEKIEYKKLNNTKKIAWKTYFAKIKLIKTKKTQISLKLNLKILK